MVIVGGAVRIDPATREAWMDHAEAMIAASRAEDGCRTYAFAFDVLDPNLVRIYEEWESRAHLEAHFATPHMAAWRDALDTIGGILSRDVRIYEADAGTPL